MSGDETSITQILWSLLSNASKYTGAGSRVRVVVEPANEAVAVRVLDQGPGIDPGEADHLFDAFYRSPNTATMASGAGIGLYVSRRLIDAMGGRIWAAPRRGRGSEFAFTLPLYWAEATPPEGRASARSGPLRQMAMTANCNAPVGRVLGGCAPTARTVPALTPPTSASARRPAKTRYPREATHRDPGLGRQRAGGMQPGGDTDLGATSHVPRVTRRDNGANDEPRDEPAGEPEPLTRATARRYGRRRG